LNTGICFKFYSYLLPISIIRFQKKGGEIKQRKVSSIEELADEFDAVVNCTGLGARFICGDTKLTPMRGQVIRVSD